MDGSLYNLSRYVDIYFEEEFKDYNINPNVNRKTRVPIKFCT